MEVLVYLLETLCAPPDSTFMRRDETVGLYYANRSLYLSHGDRKKGSENRKEQLEDLHGQLVPAAEFGLLFLKIIITFCDNPE